MDFAQLPGKDVIDLACGSGYFTRMIRARVSEDHVVWGLDISENMIKLGKKMSPFLNIKYMVQDCSVPFQLDKAFDAASCAYLFQHARNYDMLL